ncbi:polysaccharide biosynthesis tyrosine autokinase [Hymenobacter siberiensis]|uniref:polysaccharide biosynthesis tyrosine autokinase n=1 Tax=Hymenobacter siberiensis TaxID=2848396 RepID=UPI001C1DD1A2|nr:polysaccharide biosynthesis tyrosine autokinase [Hymenobacter siberiensis]
MAVNENSELEELIRNANGGAVEPSVVSNAGGNEADDESSSLDLATLVLVARRSLLWMLLLIILGVTASWLYLRYTKPVYKSTSLLKIDERNEGSALGLAGQMGPTVVDKGRGKLAGEVELIKSNIIYRRLKDSLDLDVNYYVQGTVLESEMYGTSPFRVVYKITDNALYNRKFDLKFVNQQRFKLDFTNQNRPQGGEYALGQTIALPGITLQVLPTDKLNIDALESNYHFTVQDDNTLNAYLDKNLTVEIVNPDANTIGISFNDFNAVKAQDIVNKIDSVYLVEKIASKQEATQKQLRFLDKISEENRKSLQDAEDNLQNFVQRSGTYDVKAEVGTLSSKLEKLEEDRIKLAQTLTLLSQVAQMAQQGNLTRDENQTVQQSIPALAEIEDPQLGDQLAELNSLQWNLRRLSRSYTDKTEVVQAEQAKITFTRNNIQRLLLQNQKLLRRGMDELNAQRAKLTGELQSLPEKGTELARLQRPLDLYEKSFLMLLDKKMEFNIEKAGTTADFQILSPASPPSPPIFPNRLIVYAVGLAGGLLLGLGLIAVRYFMHNTVTNVRELERNTRASVLGIIPTYDKEKMEVSRLVVDKNPKSAISESIRSIRTNLDFISSSKKKRLISVTSTISGEGKTFVTVNLGGIIALSGQKVIILDLDMRKPKVNLAFGAENTRGVSTILIDRHNVQECIQPTSIDSLQFISAGPTPPNPSELILSDRFDTMIQELFQLYDVVLIDTPPVGLVTDGILIMRKADIPLYIVRAGYSRKAFIKNMNRLIRSNNFTRMCTILNDAQSGGGYGYGYGYGYDYGYGYGAYGQGYYEEPASKKLTFGEKLKKFFT